MIAWWLGVARLAAFDLGESIRSRKVLVLLFVFLFGAVAVGAGVLEVIQDVEKQLAVELGLSPNAPMGILIDSLMRSDQTHERLSQFFDDSTLADYATTIPLLPLIFGLVCWIAVPLFTVLVSADAIAAEVATGSCRYMLFRTDRLSWCVGKAIGQATVLAGGLLVSMAGLLVVHLAYTGGHRILENAQWMGMIGVRAWVFSWPYLGLSLGFSQAVRAPHWARGLSLIGLAVLAVMGAACQYPDWVEAAPVITRTIADLLPRSHARVFWEPQWMDRGVEAAILGLLGMAGFAAGHLRFARRDV